MINVEINDGHIKMLIGGDVRELLADTMLIMHSIHASICEESVIEGYLYEHTIRKGMDLIFEPSEEDEKFLKSGIRRLR